MKANKTNLRKLNPLNLGDLHHKLFMRGVIKFEDSTPSEWLNLFNNKYEYLNDKKKDSGFFTRLFESRAVIYTRVFTR
jgi:hypothetical protein